MKKYENINEADKGKSYLDVAREIFPDATDDEADYLLWNHTGFPCFWSPRDGLTPADNIRTQLRRYKRWYWSERIAYLLTPKRFRSHFLYWLEVHPAGSRIKTLIKNRGHLNI